jgi:hypothetical protein
MPLVSSTLSPINPPSPEPPPAVGGLCLIKLLPPGLGLCASCDTSAWSPVFPLFSKGFW